MTTPLVSIVVPVFNGAKTLAVCLESARDQTYPRVELIVVDDASTDGSARIARGYGCRVLTWPTNRGVSAARNAGVAASRGEILFFLDSDVALAPDAVAVAVHALAEHPDCGCVFGLYDPEPLIPDGPVETYRILHLHWALRRAAGPTDTAVFALAAMPRTVFDSVGGFDERLRSAEDDQYSERLLPRYAIRLVPELTGRHDEADALLPLLAEQFRRSQLLPMVARNRYRPRAIRLNSTAGVLAAALTVAAAPAALLAVPLLATPVWATAAAPAVGLATFAVANPRLSAFVLGRRGPAFLVFFTGVHLLVNLALGAGLVVGAVRAALARVGAPSHPFPDPAKAGEP